MTKRSLLLIGLGMLAAVLALIILFMVVNRGGAESTIQENTKEIFSEQKTEKIEKILDKNDNQKFSSQEF